MEREAIRAALLHPDFLIVRVDPQFSGRYARIIHRVRESGHPTGRHCVLEGESELILSVLADVSRPGQYAAPGEAY